MALIQCPDCGCDVSDQAPYCRDCGRPIAAGGSPSKKGFSISDGMRLGIGIVLGLVLLSFVGCVVLAFVAGTAAVEVRDVIHEVEQEQQKRQLETERKVWERKQAVKAIAAVEYGMSFPQVKHLLGNGFKEKSHDRTEDDKARFVYVWTTPAGRLTVTFVDGKLADFSERWANPSKAKPAEAPTADPGGSHNVGRLKVGLTVAAVKELLGESFKVLDESKEPNGQSVSIYQWQWKERGVAVVFTDGRIENFNLRGPAQ